MSLQTANYIISSKKEPWPSIRIYSLIFIWLNVANAQANKETLYVTKVLKHYGIQTIRTLKQIQCRIARSFTVIFFRGKLFPYIVMHMFYDNLFILILKNLMH